MESAWGHFPFSDVVCVRVRVCARAHAHALVCVRACARGCVYTDLSQDIIP